MALHALKTNIACLGYPIAYGLMGLVYVLSWANPVEGEAAARALRRDSGVWMTQETVALRRGGQTALMCVYVLMGREGFGSTYKPECSRCA